jgi:hypothetical protein
MKKQVLAATAALLLAACGGGGGGEDKKDEGTTPVNHDVTLSVAGLAGSVVVADAGGRAVTLTANGVHQLASLPEGTAYQVSVSTQPAEQFCHVASGSGTLLAPVTLGVRCANAADLPMGSTYAVGQAVVVDVPESARSVDVRIGSQAMTLSTSAGTSVFLVPELAPGTHTLSVTVDGRGFSKPVSVMANPLAEAAPVYLNRRANAALADIQSLLAGSTVDASERAALLQLQATLQTELPKVLSLPADEALNAARLLAANDRAQVESLMSSRAAGLSGDSASADGCFRNAKLFAQGMVWVVAGIGLASTSAVAGPAVALFASAAITSTLLGAVTARQGFRGVMSECYNPKKLGVDDLDEDAQSLGHAGPGIRTLGLFKPLASAQRQLKHGVATTLTPSLHTELDAAVSDGTLSQARYAASMYDAMSRKLAPYLSVPPLPSLAAAASAQREEVKEADVSKVEVITSTPDIVVTAAPSGGKLSLTFKFAKAPYPEKPRAFSFQLRDTVNLVTSDPQAALLSPPEVPQARDKAFTMYQDGTYRGTLPPMDEATYALPEPALSGTATLLDAKTGAFTYQPRAGFVGKDAFTYTVKNASTSATRTVSVDVRPGCAPHTGTVGTGYECQATLPMTLEAPQLPVVSNLGGAITNQMIYAPGGDVRTYSQSAYVDTDKSPLAPSGTAVVLYGFTGIYDAQTDRFTQRLSSGTYDAASDAPVGRTAITRQQTILGKHADGVRYVPLSGRHAYTWMERTENLTYPSYYIFIDAQLAGYDTAGMPQYTGQRIDCTQQTHFSMDGTIQLLPRMWVTVSTIDSAGATTQTSTYEGACPMTLTDFDTIAPAITPGNARQDWKTGTPR